MDANVVQYAHEADLYASLEGIFMGLFICARYPGVIWVARRPCRAGKSTLKVIVKAIEKVCQDST